MGKNKYYKLEKYSRYFVKHLPLRLIAFTPFLKGYLNYSSVSLLILKNKMLANSSEVHNDFRKSPRLIDRNKLLYSASIEAHDKMLLKNDEIKKAFVNLERVKKSPSMLSDDSANGSSVDFELEMDVCAGEIYWGPIFAGPYWPCVIWPDQNGRTKLVNGNNVRVHVCLIESNFRSAWVKKSSLICFTNRYDFEKRKQAVMDKHGSFSLQYKPFLVNTEAENQWNQAVLQAQQMATLEIEDRKIHIMKLLTETKVVLPNGTGKRYRKRSVIIENYERMSDWSAKRRRVDYRTESAEGVTRCINGCCKQVKNEKNFDNNAEFRAFFEDIKEKILGGDNKEFETCVYTNVKNLWLIRNYTNNNNVKGIMIETGKSENNAKVTNTGSKKKITRVSKPILEVVEDILKLDPNYLFRDYKREPVCKVCLIPRNLFKCFGSCQCWLHKECGNEIEKEGHITGDVESNNNTVKEIICKECHSQDLPKCFVCQENDSSLGDCIRCNVSWCKKSFHITCLKYWPQSRLVSSVGKINSLMCPGHVCHTCVSDDPRNKFLQIDKMKLVKCVQCPATYHLDSFCIPAGTKFLTATQIICPRHRQLKKSVVNANICFICAQGGSLLCCDTCPLAFHIECLKISKPSGKYICEECETGRLPLYGELVWAKLGKYRWWPSIIIPPPEIPNNLHKINHNLHDMCVRFLGSHDHAWLSRNRVFLYQEGDGAKVNKGIKGIDQTFWNGLEEARVISETIEDRKKFRNDNIKEKHLTPIPYVKIKTNRIIPPVRWSETTKESKLIVCECKPNDLNPCGKDSNCINRMLMTECNNKYCPAGSRCENQLFEKRLYPSLKLIQTKNKGWGLASGQPIENGSFIIEYVGEIINNEEFLRREKHKREQKDESYYFLTLEKDIIIDAGPKGNLARFMNHSCTPNCETQKWKVNGVTRVGIFAITDIPAETELTFNYCFKWMSNNKQKCFCGAEGCSGFVGEKSKEPNKNLKPIQKKQNKGKRTIKKVVKQRPI